jgi:tripartite-type tricarboxylate transporter receptor subunit TctC
VHVQAVAEGRVEVKMRSLVQVFAIAGVIAVAPTTAPGADLRCSPLKLVVPFAAGGSNDIAARLVAKNLEPVLKTSVIIENRPGAAGNIGTAFVVAAPPDGCTLLVHGLAVATYPHSFKKLTFDPIADLAAVGSIGVTPTVIVTSNKGLNNLQDLFEWSRTKPDGLSYGTAGVGVLNHLLVEEMAERTKTRLVHVPYRGGAGIPQDVITGRLDFGSVTLASVNQFVTSGDMKILSVLQSTSTKLAPEAQPIAKQGFPNFDAGNHMIVLAPSKTPRSTVDHLSAALEQVVRDPGLKPHLEAVGIDAIPLNAQATDELLRKTGADWAPIIRRLNIQL